MSFAFEVDPDLDYESPAQADAFIADYGEFFGIEDFEALGIDPKIPTPAKPGSEDKVSMLAARYAAGLPLWNQEDCYDHGPGAMPDEFED